MFRSSSKDSVVYPDATARPAIHRRSTDSGAACAPMVSAVLVRAFGLSRRSVFLVLARWQRGASFRAP